MMRSKKEEEEDSDRRIEVRALGPTRTVSRSEGVNLRVHDSPLEQASLASRNDGR